MIRPKLRACLACLLVAGFAPVVQAADIAAYNLDELTGTTAADTALGNGAQNGVLMNFGVTPNWRPTSGVDGAGALKFNGVNPDTTLQYVQLEGGTTGNAANSLGVSNFTLSAYIRVLNPLSVADPVSTGGGGIGAAIPVIAKGRGEGDGSNVDMNYFLGLNHPSVAPPVGPIPANAPGGVVADYEEGAGGAGPLGQNHPVYGTSDVSRGVWQHVAATFNGTNLKVYRNGVLERTLNTPNPLRSDSIQLAAIGSALQSNGAPDGAFRGLIDNVRINNAALSDAQVANLASALTALNTVSFQEGVNSYAGTQDTNVRADDPTNTTLGGAATVLVDLETTGPGVPSQGLIRFDNLFGNGPGQVPLNATIVGATLTLNTTAESLTAANLHEMLQTWSETSTFNSFPTGGNGLQPGVEASASILDTFIPNPNGLAMDFDVTTSLQAWLLNPSQNFGWAVFQTTGDGYQFASSENANGALRPLLTVQYFINVAVVPEPSSVVLFGMLGLVGVVAGLQTRRRRVLQ